MCRPITFFSSSLIIAAIMFFQWISEGSVTQYVSEDGRGKISSAESTILTVDRFFEILHEGPTTTDIVVLNFHGKTLPNGNHLGWLGGELVEFAEEQIPEGVYIASCRGSSPDAPVHVAKRGSRDYGEGGFIAPPGKNLLGKMMWRYSDIRPHDLEWFLLAFLPFFMAFIRSYWKAGLILVGDVHARSLLVLKALLLGLLKRRKVFFAGDLIDGLKSSRKDLGLTPDWREKLTAIRSVLCVKLVRYCPWADTILGNHEVYPLWFGQSPQTLAEAWGEGSSPEIAARLWREWKAIEFFLTKGDLRWLRTRPVYIEGPTWTFVHAKVPLGGLIGIDPFIGDEGPTSWQLEVVDGTKGWKPPSCPVNNSTSLLYVGHTPINKVGGRAVWHDSLFLLDWGAKKGKGTAAWVVAGERNPKAL